MNPPILDRAWEAFLRIPSTRAADAAPTLDDVWMLTRGVNFDSPALMGLLRSEIAPLVRRLEKHLDWYSFLVHDRASGVPVMPEDRALYVHFRYAFKDGLSKVGTREIVRRAGLLKEPWLFARPQTLSPAIAGVDLSALAGDARQAWHLLGEQCEWILRIVEAHALHATDRDLVLHVRQYLHFFANMTQMRVA